MCGADFPQIWHVDARLGLLSADGRIVCVYNVTLHIVNFSHTENIITVF